MPEVLAAAEILEQEFGIASDVFSATSYAELTREAEDCARQNRLSPRATPRQPYVQDCLGSEAPVIAASDYVRAVPQMIAAYLPQRVVTLGTDGFGRSDQRAPLRAFFEIDRNSIALAAIEALQQEGSLPQGTHAAALELFQMPLEKPAPWTV